MSRVPSIIDPSKTRTLDGNVYEQVRLMAAKLFSGVRFFFAKQIRNKFNAFFLEPMFEGLGSHLTNFFRQIDDSMYEEVFQTGLSEMKKRLQLLEIQLAKCEANRQRFHLLHRKINAMNVAPNLSPSLPTMGLSSSPAAVIITNGTIRSESASSSAEDHESGSD